MKQFIVFFIAMAFIGMVTMLALEEIANTYNFAHAAHYTQVYLGDDESGKEHLLYLTNSKEGFKIMNKRVEK